LLPTGYRDFAALCPEWRCTLLEQILN
jgi:hypothetical protein